MCHCLRFTQEWLLPDGGMLIDQFLPDLHVRFLPIAIKVRFHGFAVYSSGCLVVQSSLKRHLFIKDIGSVRPLSFVNRLWYTMNRNRRACNAPSLEDRPSRGTSRLLAHRQRWKAAPRNRKRGHM